MRLPDLEEGSQLHLSKELKTVSPTMTRIGEYFPDVLPRRGRFGLTPVGAARKVGVELGSGGKTLQANYIVRTFADVASRGPMQVTPELFAEKLSEWPIFIEGSITLDQAQKMYVLVTGDPELKYAVEFLEQFEAGRYSFYLPK